MQAFFTTTQLPLLSRALHEKWVDPQVAIKLIQMNPVCTLTHFISAILILVSHLHVCLQYNPFHVGYSLKFFVHCSEFLCTFNYDLWLVKKHLIFARFIDCLCISCTKPLSDHNFALLENSLCSVCTPMVLLQSTVLFFTSSGIVLYASCCTKGASLGFVLTVVCYYYFLWHRSWQTRTLNYHIYMNVRWPWQ
jgi:hypothetical protein